MKQFITFHCLVCCALILLLNASCAVKKETATPQQVTYTLPQTVSYSAPFRHFWEAWCEEGNPIQPDNAFINHHRLQKVGDSYAIAGFVELDATAEVEAIRGLVHRLTPYSNGLCSFVVTLEQLPEFVQASGIIRIEQSAPARLR